MWRKFGIFFRGFVKKMNWIFNLVLGFIIWKFGKFMLMFVLVSLCCKVIMLVCFMGWEGCFFVCGLFLVLGVFFWRES